MPPPAAAPPPRRAWLGRGGGGLGLTCLALVLGSLRPQFLTLPNLVNVARQISLNGILAVGVTYVLLTGGVDLSLGSVVALTGVVAATFAHPGHFFLAPI